MLKLCFRCVWALDSYGLDFYCNMTRNQFSPLWLPSFQSTFPQVIDQSLSLEQVDSARWDFLISKMRLTVSIWLGYNKNLYTHAFICSCDMSISYMLRTPLDLGEYRSGTHTYKTHPACPPGAYILGQELAYIFIKGPDNKFLDFEGHRICFHYVFCIVLSKTL